VQRANECNNLNAIFKCKLREKIIGLPGLEDARTIVETLHLPVTRKILRTFQTKGREAISIYETYARY